ncbi:Transcriptional regulatory protein [Neofusicoccum parvum]|uniref:Transcriptional regulatory protein n=1 Tax=Neofusicoccum parvum TaxID=310453 RepID=A0ACB5SGF6_9PEZI|nr:Transcriptional regulatory protein [Neofusicoccum parvum]
MNGRPTTLPPKTFLLSALDIYLSEINIYNPIFKESSLREAVELRYSTPALSPDPDREAWSLCFNNIILLAMCHTARLTDNGSGDSQGIEHDLLQSFLRNTCRAIHNLERLSSPRFVNIQALATLALVGKECFEGCFFSQMLPRVFQIVRSTGLHRAQAHRSTAGASPDERRMLYWTLYRLDKQRCFLKGQPCDLYSFDTDIPMVTHEPDTPESRFITAMNSLMAVWEKIYLLLYSPQVKMRRRRYVDEQVSELELALKGWYRRHSDLLSADSSPHGTPPDGPHLFFRAELSFCFALSSLLIHRCVDGPGSRRKGLEAAQTALRIVANVRAAAPRSASVAFLGRIFHQYPALPFVEVYRHAVEHPARARALAPLLAAAVAAAADLANPGFPRVFAALLRARMAWCLDVVEVFAAAACGSPSPSPPSSSSLAVSRKGSLVDAPLLSRSGSVVGVPGLGVPAALDGFAGGGALFGGGLGGGR